MTIQDAKEFIVQSVKDDVDIAKLADAIEAIEQEPCEDCVSRESVNRLINLGWNKGIYPSGAIRALPSVKPTAQKGHWIWCGGSHKCSNCGGYTCFGHKEMVRYCPNCGARME